MEPHEKDCDEISSQSALTRALPKTKGRNL